MPDVKPDLGVCPKCGRKIELGDVDWRGGSTEAGTDFYTVYIDCPCG